ncbi:hypothetical protein [Psychrobacter sp.]|nr:hypothetical protein [Psychrobacter sp.]
MSSNYNNNPERQDGNESLLNESAYLYNSKDKQQSRKLTTMASYALLLGSTSLVLAGCQSTTAVSSNASPSGALIDFNIADSSQSQAQGRAFNANLQADSEHYEQLFDQDKYPNTENQAKSRLLTAIRQHLATEHVAVAHANYHTAPFIDPDSIDAGSTSLLRTIIDTYLYTKETSDADESEYDSDYEEYDEYNYVAEADAEAEIAAIVYEYDEDGYNQYGYDREGYDWYGYDEAGYDEYGYDEDGYDKHGYDEYGYTEEDYDAMYSEPQGVMAKLRHLDFNTVTEQYEAMQMAKQNPENKTTRGLPTSSTGVIGQMLGMFHRTPEQIAAANAYQYKNLTFNSVSHYKPGQRQLQSVYGYDYVSPTITSSVQIPLAFDFNNSNVTVDPSAVLPLVALAFPGNAPLPSEMTSHTVDFGLPDSITEQLPPSVLYDAAIDAIENSMAELAPEYFSAVDISNDAFAKEVGAKRAVKVYFGSQQSGEMIGKVLKYMSQSLEDYVDANPEKYPDNHKLKVALEKVQLYNKGYQSADVGSLLQLVEAIGPISFNQTNYYYLDNSDHLLAKQQRLNMGGDLMGDTTSVINQVRYDQGSFNDHALTPLLAESFGENAKPAIDGNAWIAEQRLEGERRQQARYARYGYSDDYYNNDYEDSAEVSDAMEYNADHSGYDEDSDDYNDNYNDNDDVEEAGTDNR